MLNLNTVLITSQTATIGRFFYLLAVFVVVIALAYFSTKMIANSGLKKSRGNLKIIENISVGHQNHLQLIKAGNKYFIIGVSKERITYLRELNPEDLPHMEKDDNPAVKAPFEKYLNQIIQRKDKKQ